MEHENNGQAPDRSIIDGVIVGQLRHFKNTVPPCRGMQLPDGVLLRHTQSQSLYFYLKTKVEDGKIATLIYASDSPYDRQKTNIGEVHTPMFDPEADAIHLRGLEGRIRQWVDFVAGEPSTDHEFQSFVLRDRPQ